ncbi:hypothetical protein LT493_17810 [Streptomyces tricolor]|nr:hypothetical protein [Streptomyces tricolor]
MPPARSARLLTDSRALATLARPARPHPARAGRAATTDTVMMGLIGTEALAAGGLAMVIFNQLRTMGVPGSSPPSATRSPRPTRAPRRTRAIRGPREERYGTWCGRACCWPRWRGLAGAVLMVLVGHAVVLLDPRTRTSSTRRSPCWYAMAPGLIPCLWFQAASASSPSAWAWPQALLRITIASIAVNAGLNWLFIHGT